MKRNVIAVGCWLLAVSGASAEEVFEGPAAVEDVTEYAFEDDLVKGDLVSPNGEILNVRRRGQRESLIRVRDHFIDRLLRSVERL